MRLSVVIPARNAEAVLSDQLAALAAQRLPADWTDEWEVVVVDHASTDRTADTARSWSDRIGIHVVSAPAGHGVGHVRNVGAATAKGDLLLFCDADDVVDDHWVSAMAEMLEHLDVVAGAADHWRLNDPSTVDWRIHDHVEGLPDGLGFLPIASSSNMGVRREAFEAVGGFDPDLLAVEDKDISFRLLLAGYRLGFAPNALVAYRHRADLRSLWRQQWNYGRGDVQLFERYRTMGMQSPDPISIGRSWLGLLVRLPLLVNRRRRGQWVRIAATRLSRVAESRRLRVWYP